MTHTPIKRAPGYTIDGKGCVLSTASNWRGYGVRQITPTLNSDGYLQIRLVIDGKRKCYPVHKLVAETFLPSRPSPRHETRHTDGDKLNNDKSNLAWGTRKDNAKDRERHGKTSRGERHSNAIKTSPKWTAYWEDRRNV